MSSQEQINASFLRGRFLDVISNFEGKPCSIILYDNSTVNATLISSTGDYNHIAVEDLHTPIGIVSSALIRTKDIQNLIIKTSIENV